jgi:hypothetical protein
MRWVFWAMALALGPATSARADDCPDLAGHYRVDGFGPVLGDALEALRLGTAGFTHSEVKITGDAGQTLRFFAKSGQSAPMASEPSRVLSRGEDYDCAGGALTLRGKVSSSRKTDAGFFEGHSIVRLTRSGSGLSISTEFRGGERTTLYSYESARVSIPKLGTGRSLSEHIRWPGIDEARPLAPQSASVAESAQVVELRRQLNSVLAGAVRLAALKDTGGDKVHASLSASKSADIIAFEDRLRDAGLVYSMTSGPTSSNNGYYMEMLFSTAAGGAQAWRPSPFRVQHEIERIRHPMVSVRKVQASDNAYIAELNVIGAEPVEPILQRLRANTAMFASIEVLDDRPQPDQRNLRALRLRLSVD